MVWIRFPGLNLYFYDESILLALAGAVGKPVKVDSNTLDVRRGRFAHVCVEVDLNKPVIGKVWLQGFWYHVEYEGLHRICNTCGCYGHFARNCTKATTGSDQKSYSDTMPENQSQMPENQSQPQDMAANHQPKESPASSSAAHSKEGNIPDNGAASRISSPTKIEENAEEPLHGDWLVVKNKNRKSKATKSDKGGRNPKVNTAGIDKEKIAKSHAKRETYKSNANQKAGMSRGPKILQKPRQPVYANVKGKRRRKENDSPQWPAPQAIWPHVNHPKDLITLPQVNQRSNKGIKGKEVMTTMVHDLGYGAKSTVELKAISGNRFLMIHDEEFDTQTTDMIDNRLQTTSNPQGTDQEVVPETQPYQRQ